MVEVHDVLLRLKVHLDTTPLGLAEEVMLVKAAVNLDSGEEAFLVVTPGEGGGGGGGESLVGGSIDVIAVGSIVVSVAGGGAGDGSDEGLIGPEGCRHVLSWPVEQALLEILLGCLWGMMGTSRGAEGTRFGGGHVVDELSRRKPESVFRAALECCVGGLVERKPDGDPQFHETVNVEGKFLEVLGAYEKASGPNFVRILGEPYMGNGGEGQEVRLDFVHQREPYF